MYDAILLLFTIIAFILLLISKLMQDTDEPYWSPVLAFVAMFLFFVLALGVVNIDIPYEQYNATSGMIETGVHVYTGSWEMITFYAGMGFVSLVIMVIYIFQSFQRLTESTQKVKLRKYYHK